MSARRSILRIRELVGQALEITRYPRVRIEMSGGEACHGLYEAFTRRHSRWRVIQGHSWGVALLALPDTTEAYYGGPDRSHLRREHNRAKRAGFTFTRIDPLARVDEVMAINRSADQRQGRPIHRHYLDGGIVRRYFERSEEVYGVQDASGVLRAYLCLRTCGEVAVVERLLGHHDFLRHGVMWVLVPGVVELLIERRRADRRPTWLMYDMFTGAEPGMRQFKRWIGCEPHRVLWRWREQERAVQAGQAGPEERSGRMDAG